MEKTTIALSASAAKSVKGFSAPNIGRVHMGMDGVVSGLRIVGFKKLCGSKWASSNDFASVRSS